MAPLTASPLPDSRVRLARWVLNSPAELGRLRHGVHYALTGRSLPPDAGLDGVPEKMVMVASELATNALQHGRPPTIVTLYRAGDSFLLDVADHDPRLIPEYAETRPPGAGGLGLKLARDLAVALGWFADDESPTPLKHVWAQFPAP
ncbi:ATP-binding protein [Cryptosporangium phraense]|uniref:ATP-binding protein n=1 Tax=Cryptosporangium phraense TaxID=2593070 RepID=A0A545AQP1_9ACTN|nr:ATP-binding protein [Cryptosporangium phraense]TQS43025.1 ATP-binding protein [Cryptosporangium phraense]